MAVYNPRLDIARAAQQQAKSSSVQTLQSVLKQQTMDSTLNRDYTAMGGANTVPDAGGWKGLVTDILESPVGKVVSKAGEIISLPGRAVTSTVMELKDALDSDPNTVASWNDFTKQVADPTFGFGRVIGNATGSAWANRILGFAGDVLLDPLTYVTLGAGRISGGMKLLDEAGAVVKGAKSVSIVGKEGRLAFASRLAEIGAPNDIVTRAARYGRVAVKDADLLAKAGVNRAGLYFMGRRVAGTTSVGKGLERGIVGMRTWSGDHMFKRAAELFDSTDMNAARKALARGTAGADEGAEYLHMVVSRNTERAEQAAQKRAAQVLQRQLLGSVNEADLKSARGTAYTLLDNSDAAARAGTATADERLAGPVVGFLKQLHDNIDVAAKAVDPDAPVGRITNYFPHLPAEKAYRFMANSENPVAVKLANLLYNPLTEEGVFKSRMVAGDDFFGYILKQEDIDGGLVSLNKIARREGKIDFDFFETDLPSVLDRYVDMYSAQMGKIARKKYLAEKGVFKRLEERLLINDEAVDSATKNLKKAVADRRGAMTNASKALGKLNDSFDELFTRTNGARESVFQAQQTLGTLIEELTLHDKTLSRILGDRPEVLNALEGQYSRILKDLKEAQKQAEIFENIDGVVRPRLAEAAKELEQLQKIEGRLIEFGNVVQNRFDDIVNGMDIPNAKQFSENVRKALFGDSRVQGGRRQRVFGVDTESTPVNGKLWEELKGKVQRGSTGGPRNKMTPAKESLLAQRYAEAGGEWSKVDVSNLGAVDQRWWMLANPDDDISATAVADMMGSANLVEAIYRGVRDEASLKETRLAAMAILSLHDGSTALPAGLADQLKDILAEAADVDNFYMKLARSNTDKFGRFRLETIYDNYSKVENQVVDSVYEYAAAVKLKNTLFKDGVPDPDATYGTDLLKEFLDTPEYDSLLKYFDFDKTNITFNDFANRLDEIRIDAMTREFKIVAPIKGVGVTDTDEVIKTINMEDYMNALKLRDTDGGRIYRGEASIDDVQRWISDNITGESGVAGVRAPRRIVTADDLIDLPNVTALVGMNKLVPGLTRMINNRKIDERIVKWLTGAADAKTYVSMNNDLRAVQNIVQEKLAVLGKKLKDVPESDWSEVDRLLLDNMTLASRQLDDATKDISDRISAIVPSSAPRGNLPRARAVTFRDDALPNNSLRGEIESLRTQLFEKYGIQRGGTGGSMADETTWDASTRSVRGRSNVAGAKADVRAGTGTRQGVRTAQQAAKQKVIRVGQEEMRARLANATLEAWFTTEVQTRFSRVADLMFKEGLVPDQDMYRKIVNIVAKEHGEVIQAEAAVYRRAEVNLNDLIAQADGWSGDPADLYTLIDNALSANNGDDMAEWVTLLSKVNGREDVSNMKRLFLRLGSEEGNTGIPKRKRVINSKLRSKTITAEERTSLEAELSALPDNATLKRQKDSVVKVWRDWYAKHVDPTNETASYQEIGSAIRELTKTNITTGRLSEDASVREMLTWLKASQERVATAGKQSSKSRTWLTVAQDPFVDVSKIVIGGRRPGQDVPSMYGGILNMLARQYEEAVGKFQVINSTVEGASKKLDEVVVAEPALLAKREGLVGKGRLDKVTVDLPEREALLAARKAHRQLEELQNSPEYFAAIEREQLDSLLRVFANYDVSGDVSFSIPVTGNARARQAVNKGEKVYVEQNGQYIQIDDVTDYISTAKKDIDVRIAEIDDRVGTLRKEVSDMGWSPRDMQNTKPRAQKLGEIDFLQKEKTTLNTQKLGINKFYRENTDAATKTSRPFVAIEDGFQQQIVYYENGKRQIFTLNKNEFEALYSIGDPKAYASARQSQRIAMDKEIADVDNELLRLDPTDAVTAESMEILERLPRQIKKYEAEYRAARSAMRGDTFDAINNRKFVADYESAIEEVKGLRRNMPIKPEVRNRILKLRQQREALASRRKAMEFKFVTQEQAAPEVVLQKMHGLLQAIKSGETSFDDITEGLVSLSKQGNNDFNRVTNISRINARKKMLNDIWDVSSDKKFLDKTRKLESTVEIERFNVSLSNTDEALETISKMRIQANAALVKRQEVWPEVWQAKANLTGGVFQEKIVKGRLQKLSEIVGGQVDTVKRFDELLASGSTPTKAMETILDEIKILRPANERLVTVAGERLKELVKTQEMIQLTSKEIGFLNSAIENFTDIFWKGTDTTDSIGQKILYATRLADQIKSNFDDELVKFLDDKSDIITYTEARYNETAAKIRDVEKTLLEASSKFDTASALRMEFGAWQGATTPKMRWRLAKAEQVLADYKNVTDLPIGGSAIARAEYLNWVDEISQVIDDVADGPTKDVINRLRADYVAASESLLAKEMRVVDAQYALDMFKSGKWGAGIEKDLTDGFESLAKFGMPNFQARREIKEMFDNVSRMREPEFVRGLNKFIGRYTGFFKAYATASPGFVVRNTMSNTFMLVASGADPRNLYRGLGHFTSWRQSLTGIGEKAWIESLPQQERKIIETAIRAMDAAGTGRGAEAMKLWSPKRKWLVENKWIRTWRSANEVTENSARFMLAFDQASKGATFDQATATVKRFLFDYEDVGTADVTMRSIVPFWFWMSRNLPLQMTNRYLNPRAYNIYRSAMNNFGQDVNEDDNVPSWLTETGGIKVGEGLFFAPDLGFNRVNQQLNELKDPKRLLSYVNPILRVPFEVGLSDKRFYNDVPFSDKPQQTVGGPASPVLDMLAGLLNQTRPMGNGEQGVTDKFNYGIMNMIPPLAQAERLAPATDLYKGRQSGSIMSYLGIPLRQVTPQMENQERRRRNLEQEALRNIASGGQ
jgi:hypothetical protein